MSGTIHGNQQNLSIIIWYSFIDLDTFFLIVIHETTFRMPWTFFHCGNMANGTHLSPHTIRTDPRIVLQSTSTPKKHLCVHYLQNPQRHLVASLPMPFCRLSDAHLIPNLQKSMSIMSSSGENELNGGWWPYMASQESQPFIIMMPIGRPMGAIDLICWLVGLAHIVMTTNWRDVSTGRDASCMADDMSLRRFDMPDTLSMRYRIGLHAILVVQIPGVWISNQPIRRVDRSFARSIRRVDMFM